MKQHLDYPLTGNIAKIIFGLLVLFSLTVVADICTDLFKWQRPYRAFLLEFFIVINALCIMAFSKSNDQSEFLGRIIKYLFFYGPAFCLVLFSSSSFVFLYFLISANILAISHSFPETEKNWDKLISLLYIIWVVNGVILSIGKAGYLPYSFHLSESVLNSFAQKISFIINNPKLHFLLDLRLVLSSIIATLVACTALKKTFNEKLPKIPRLPYLMKQFYKKNNSILESIVLPFGVVIYYIYKALHLIVDAVLRLIILIIYYIYKFVQNFIIYLVALLTTKKLWLNLCKVFLSLFMVIVFAKIMRFITPDLYKYLVYSAPFKKAIIQHFIPLFKIFAFFILSLIAISFHRCIWYGLKEWHCAMDRAAIAGTTIFLSSFFAGVLSHITNRFTPIEVSGFEFYGPFLILVGCLMIILTLYVFTRSLTDKAK